MEDNRDNLEKMLGEMKLDERTQMLEGVTGEGKARSVEEITPMEFHPIDIDSAREKVEKPREFGSEIYDQAWYKMLKEKCEKEPNKRHVIFLDQGSMDDEAFKKRIAYLEDLYKAGILPSNATIGYSGNKEVVLETEKPQEAINPLNIEHEFNHMMGRFTPLEYKPLEQMKREAYQQVADERADALQQRMNDFVKENPDFPQQFAEALPGADFNEMVGQMVDAERHQFDGEMDRSPISHDYYSIDKTPYKSLTEDEMQQLLDSLYGDGSKGYHN